MTVLRKLNEATGEYEKVGVGGRGRAATIKIGTVTTLAPDSPATAENVGTDTDAILNFGIPQGASGAGSGDMLKSVYDKDGDGVIDRAAVADDADKLGGKAATDFAAADHKHSAADVGAAAADHTHTPATIGAAEAGHTHTPAAIGAATADHKHSAADVGADPAGTAAAAVQAHEAKTNPHGITAAGIGAAAEGHKHTPAEIGAQPVLSFDAVPTEGSGNPVTSGGVYNALAGLGGGSADWAVNDPEAEGYVKNRTHYADFKKTTLWVTLDGTGAPVPPPEPDEEGNIIGTPSPWRAMDGYYELRTRITALPVVGDYYVVGWKGKDIPMQCLLDDHVGIYMGNPNIVHDTMVDNGLPIFITFGSPSGIVFATAFAIDDPENVNVNIFLADAFVLPLPGMFIQDTIERVCGGVKIEGGSYVGTGSKVTLDFNIKPAVLFIHGQPHSSLGSRTLVFIGDVESHYLLLSTTSTYNKTVKLAWSNVPNTSVYRVELTSSFSCEGTDYTYIAIGKGGLNVAYH